jgi:hypothetical protein
MLKLATGTSSISCFADTSGIDTGARVPNEAEYRKKYVEEHEKYEREKANMPPGVFPAPPPQERSMMAIRGVETTEEFFRPQFIQTNS